MDITEMASLQIIVLRGCDSCGSSLVHPHEFHCDPCLIASFEQLIRNCHEATYLDAEFKDRLLGQYQARLEQFKLRSHGQGAK